MVTRLSVLLPCHKCKGVCSEVKDEEVPSPLPWEYTPVITPEQLKCGSCFPVYTASYDICQVIWGSLSLIGDSQIVTPYSMRKCSIRFEEIGPILWQFFYMQGSVGRSNHGSVSHLPPCWVSELQVALVPMRNSGWKISVLKSFCL